MIYECACCGTANCGIPCRGCASSNPGHKFKVDGVKLRPSLFPWPALNFILRVLEFGAKKYTAHSWRNVEPQLYIEALLRHAAEFGERHRTEGVFCKDRESGLPVISHLACNAVILLAHPACASRALEAQQSTHSGT
jgi:hypothetical protein